MRTKPKTTRLAMTLIEVIIVISIILLLAGLSIPAVQRAREFAASRKCQNQLRQLALAAQNYDSSCGSLPPGYLGNVPNGTSPGDPSFFRAQWIGVLPYLLPYIGLDAQYRQMDMNWSLDSLGPPWYEESGNISVARGHVEVFQCPSDDPYLNIGSSIQWLGYFPIPPDKAWIEVGLVDDARGGPIFGRTNYVGVSGKFGRVSLPAIDQFEGVFTNRSRVSLQQVSANDGTSNVLMFGESLGGSYPGPRDHAFLWMGVGVTGAANGIFEAGDFSSFSSSHMAIVNFVCCDGSVRPMQKNISVDLLLKLAAFHDGNAVE